jgi:S-adenosyl-L-methionine hydrolase (adenosine-forming)
MTPPFKPSGIITLTTDFGQQDPFVAVMKGSILTRFPAARLVDLTHEIVVHWPAEAGFWLARSFEYFPSGTVHAAVVDPGVGTARDIVVVRARGHVLIAPDNGLLAPVVSRCSDATTVRLAPQALQELRIDRVSPTFHGRDIFAPIAAELAAGRRAPESLGPPASALIPSWVEEPEVRGGQVLGTVITIDHFGNLITNIDASLVRDLRAPQVRAGSHTFRLLRTYGDVRPGEHLALINAFEVLEIACAERSAAESLGLSRGAPVTVQEGRDSP